MAIFTSRPQPPISKIEIEQGKKKITLSPQVVRLENGKWILENPNTPFLPYDHQDFYLAEDLLDKQVIDTDGKRLVRVNDVVLEQNGELKVTAIDIGFPGILRRLGIPMSTQSKWIPWQFIEAFDYQTGNIKIKLSQTKLNALHPSELADILEDVGTKERLGLVAALDAKKAARAIEETNDQTQMSILEEVSVPHFKDVLNTMRLSELADVLDRINPMKTREIQAALGEERAQKVRKLFSYSDNVAGGLMRTSFLFMQGTKTVKEALKVFAERAYKPETILIVNEQDKLIGTIQTKNFLNTDSLASLQDIVEDKQFVYSNAAFDDVFRLFSEYNLRAVPVVDKEKKPIGMIVIDDLLKSLDEKREKDEEI